MLVEDELTWALRYLGGDIPRQIRTAGKLSSLKGIVCAVWTESNL